MNQVSQNQLLKFIYEVGFAIDDVILYLDTHPCDACALEYYYKYKELKQQAVEEYTRFFGPLTMDNVESKNKWAWIREPWPWEGDC